MVSKVTNVIPLWLMIKTSSFTLEVMTIVFYQQMYILLIFELLVQPLLGPSLSLCFILILLPSFAVNNIFWPLKKLSLYFPSLFFITLIEYIRKWNIYGINNFAPKTEENKSRSLAPLCKDQESTITKKEPNLWLETVC